MTIACWNIHLQNNWKRDKFVDFISKHTSIQLCAVVETWLKDSDLIMEKQLEDTGFTWIGKDREGRRGGGVGFMVKDNLNPKKVSESRNGNELWISIGRKDLWYIAVVYMPPADKNYEIDIQSLQQNALKFAAKAKVIIMGAFNARVGKCQ